MKARVLLMITLVSSVLVACAGNPNSPLAKRCEARLEVAERTLKIAKAKRARGHVNITKAAGLIAAARIQYEFGKYPNCIEKANRARAYLRKIH